MVISEAMKQKTLTLTAGAIALSSLLSGCILVAQQQAETGKKQLVGKSKSAILACAGVPNATYKDGVTEYLAYSAAGGVSTGGSSTYVGNGMFINSGHTNQAQCVVTIAIRGGVVSNINYRSSGGAITAPDEACGYVVRSCL